MNINPIAHIRTGFSEKFGIPRQSGLVEGLTAKITFEPEYRNPDAFRGIEGYSHLWLLWEFSEAKRDHFAPMVHPPRLGGNTRRGVFATRSPFRPNPIGLSSVKLVKYYYDNKQGPVLIVEGADLLDGTPIFDIKPYLAFTDSHPEAAGGFADDVYDYHLDVIFPEELQNQLPPLMLEPVTGILRQDPRPSYQNDPDRRYGVSYSGYDIRFKVDGRVLTVVEIVRLPFKKD